MRTPRTSRTGRVLGAFLTLVVATTFVLTVNGNEENGQSLTLMEPHHSHLPADAVETDPCREDPRRSEFVTFPCPDVQVQARSDAKHQER